MPLVIHTDDGIIVGILGAFIQQDRGPGNSAGDMVIERDHMKQPCVALFTAAPIAKESLLNLLTIDCERLMLGAVGSESSAILVYILIPRRLIHVPDPPVATCLLIER